MPRLNLRIQAEFDVNYVLAIDDSIDAQARFVVDQIKRLVYHEDWGSLFEEASIHADVDGTVIEDSTRPPDL